MMMHDMHKSGGDELLSAASAATLLPQTSASTLLRWARTGKVPYIRLPSGRVFFRRADVEALLEPVEVGEDLGPFGDPLPGLESEAVAV